MDNDVSQVIDRTDLIENLLNQVIEKYTSPRQEVFEFFWNVILDSSIMSLGSKIKVAMAISQRINVKLKSHPIHQIVSLRNAFAHHGLNSHPTLAIGKEPDKDELHYTLQIIRQSGKIERKTRKGALEEFNKNYELAKESLLALRDAVENSAK